ncbi:MAG TPA: hypothetical protein VIX82_15680 [Solirubrobacteraceae bacterium]
MAAGVRAEVAESLGSDVPGLIDAGAVLATGAGEVVQRIDQLAPHAFAILPQPFGLSTAEVYAQADRMRLTRSAGDLQQTHRALRAALGSGAELTAAMLVNDLQPAALALAPQIEGALRALRAAGAERAIVCGSGPTAAGVFWGHRAAERAAAAVATLAGEHPAAVAVLPVGRAIPAAARAHLRSGAQSVSR